MGGLFNGTCCGYHNGRGQAESGPEALRRDYMRAKWVYCAALLLTGVASWVARDYAPKALLALPGTFDYCAIPTAAANGAGDGAAAVADLGNAAEQSPPPPSPANGTSAEEAPPPPQPQPPLRRRQRALLEVVSAPPAPTTTAAEPESLGSLASLTGLIAAALPQGLAAMLPASLGGGAAAAGSGSAAAAAAAAAAPAAAPASSSLLLLSSPQNTATNATTAPESATTATTTAATTTSPTTPFTPRQQNNLDKQRLVAALDAPGRRRLEACVGRQAAVRVSFASSAFFLLHAALMVACARERDVRAGLHSSLMAPRLLLWLGAIVGALFLPQQAAAYYAQCARAGGALFLVFAMVECVQSVYAANLWLLGRQAWWAWVLLVTGAILALGGGFAALGAAFWYYAPGDQPACRLNTLFCALSVVAGALMVLVLFVPGRRSEAGLLTSGAVLLYGTWLLFSALSTEPRGVAVVVDGLGAEGAGPAIAAAPLGADLCVPRLGGVSDRATVIAGFFVGIAAVCYSTLNVGTSAVWTRGGRATGEVEGEEQAAAAAAAAAAGGAGAFVVLDDNNASFSVARAGGAHGGGDGLTSFSAGAGGGGGGGKQSILGSRPPQGSGGAPAAACDGAASVYVLHQAADGSKCASPVPAPAAAALLWRLGQRDAGGGGGGPDDDPALPPIVMAAPAFAAPSSPAAFTRRAERLGHRLAYRPDMFHVIYALAAMYLAMLFTNWEVAAAVVAADGAAAVMGGGGGGGGSSAGASLAAFQFGGGWSSVWVKMATKWFCEALYLWTVLAPALCGRWREFSAST